MLVPAGGQGWQWSTGASRPISCCSRLRKSASSPPTHPLSVPPYPHPPPNARRTTGTRCSTCATPRQGPPRCCTGLAAARAPPRPRDAVSRLQRRSCRHLRRGLLLPHAREPGRLPAPGVSPPTHPRRHSTPCAGPEDCAELQRLDPSLSEKEAEKLFSRYFVFASGARAWGRGDVHAACGRTAMKQPCSSPNPIGARPPSPTHPPTRPPRMQCATRTTEQ